jgi:hypothetical protein
MTIEEFKSFKRGLAYDAVQLRRKKMTEEEYYRSLVVALGKDIFEETITVMDEKLPE